MYQGGYGGGFVPGYNDGGYDPNYGGGIDEYLDWYDKNKKEAS